MPTQPDAPQLARLREAAQLIWITAQLGVILLLARAFHIESAAFIDLVLPLAFGGFVVHHWLPRRFQPPFFAALSIAGIFLIFGLAPGAWLVGVGLGLIALCHLPIAFTWRLLLIGLAAVTLMAMRATWLPAPWPAAIWPILGSMFMFRLAMYLYDLKHRGPGSPGFVLSYFFLLPNSVFLLFPVIDFQTFKRTHYDRPAMEIYSEGVRWILRGLSHLVLYRVIYQYVALSPAEVVSTAGLVQYLVGNYGLYLRVSGQFHMIVGLLHLFGFRLPETHRFFYLASSFSDFWRRINIYWKDFMQKMVYLPVIFSMKRQGQTMALVAASSCVVVVTWFLHSYQWFWLLGTWLFSATDIAFWGGVGVLLVVNALREQRRSRTRQLTAQAPASPHPWRDALQTAGMFALMAFLWGLWTSPTFEEFRVMLQGTTLRLVDVGVVLGTLAVVAVAAFTSNRFSLGAPSALALRSRWQHPLVVGALPLTLFWLLGEPLLSGRVPGPLQALAQDARLVELNEYDAERLQRGYYERIVGVNKFNGELWEVYARAQGGLEPDPAVETEELAVKTDRFGNRSLLPLSRTTFRGGQLTANRWGFRDKDYDQTPPPSTIRTVVLGQSYVLGSGVNDGEPFEQVVEDRLNREWRRKTGLRYELLNFAMPRLAMAEQAVLLQSGRVEQFRPDVVLVVGHAERFGFGPYFGRLVARGRALPEPVDEWAREAGIVTGMSEAEVLRRLTPRQKDLVEWSLQTMASEIRRMGARPVFALIPMPYDPTDAPTKPMVLTAAMDAGFEVIDMQNVFDRHDDARLVLNPADRHPNAEGHRIIAGRLYEELTRRAEVLTPAKK